MSVATDAAYRKSVLETKVDKMERGPEDIIITPLPKEPYPPIPIPLVSSDFKRIESLKIIRDTIKKATNDQEHEIKFFIKGMIANDSDREYSKVIIELRMIP